MRFLFTMHPAFGHFHAMVPLAQACKEHGHEVAFATGKSFGPVIRRNGYLHFPCGLDFDGSTDIFEALPGWSANEAKHPTDGLQQLYGFIQELAPRMADDLIGLVSAWRPDVIVRDPVEFGGYIAAEYHGLPHATPIWATYISAKALCPEAVGELRRRYGLPDDPGLDTLDRYLVLDFLPSSWTFPNLPYPRVAHRFCAPPFDLSSGDARLPDWLSTLPHQPTVYATLGTTFNRSPGTFQAILTALSTEPVNLIMTVGRSMDPTAIWATTRPRQDRAIYSTDASPASLRRAHLPRRLQFLAVRFLAWSADGHYPAGCRRQPPYGLAVRRSGRGGAGRGQSAATRSDSHSSQNHTRAARLPGKVPGVSTGNQRAAQLSRSSAPLRNPG